MTFPVNRFDEISQRADDFSLIERIPLTRDDVTFPVVLNTPVGDEKTIVLLDTETTGTDTQNDKLIELGMVKISYSPSAWRITSVDKAVSWLEDPQCPIPEEASLVNGLTNADVDGHAIEDEWLKAWLWDDPKVVAHNAEFDRQVMEKRFGHLSYINGLAWGCSFKDIDWKARGFSSAKQESLLIWQGWFYSAHRAATDCLALAWLFHLMPEAFGELLDNIEKTEVTVRAIGSPFSAKDALKARGYYWFPGDNAMTKNWWCKVKEDDLAEERAFLDQTYMNGSQKAMYEHRTARERFKYGS